MRKPGRFRWALLAAVLALLAACGNEKGITFEPTTTPGGIVAPSPQPTPVPPRATKPAPTVPVPTSKPSLTATPPFLPSETPVAQPESTPLPPAAPAGKLVGVWNVPLEDLSTLAGYGVNAVFYTPRDPQELVAYLETAEQLGVRVLVNLVKHRNTVDPSCLSAQGGANPDSKRCPFDPQAFRAALEPYRQTDLSRFAGTTLYAHVLLDEPFDPTNWGGSVIPDDALRAASTYSREALGEAVPTALNAGYIPPNLAPGLADIIMSTFYANKRTEFGSLDSYLADQFANLSGAVSAQPALRYIIFLQAFGGAKFGPFPSPEAMEAEAVAACQHPSVEGVMWWTWRTRQVTDFKTTMSGPDAQAYAEMIQRVAKACGN